MLLLTMEKKSFFLFAFLFTVSRCIDAEAQAPEGGNRYGKNLIGETQSFFCEKDKMLIGSAFIHCRKNGTWSSKPPVCKRTY